MKWQEDRKLTRWLHLQYFQLLTFRSSFGVGRNHELNLYFNGLVKSWNLYTFFLTQFFRQISLKTTISKFNCAILSWLTDWRALSVNVQYSGDFLLAEVGYCDQSASADSEGKQRVHNAGGSNNINKQ